MIYPGDCRSYVWEGDVMITDPPYSAHVHESIRSSAQHGEVKGVRQNDLGFEHLTSELMSRTCQLAAKVKRWSVIFSDIESVGNWAQGLEEAGAEYIRAIPWIRWSMPQLSGDRPPQGCEMLVIAHSANSGRKRWNGPGNLTHYSHKCLRGEGKHRAEKPLDMGLTLVSHFSDPGEMIIDPFAGSGTFGTAAVLLGREETGCELDDEWIWKAQARIEDAKLSRLSQRDQKRYDMWTAAMKIEQEEKARMAAHTAKVRTKAENERSANH